MSHHFGETLRDAPGDVDVLGHQLLLRAGYIRQLAAGIFSYLPLGFRSMRKIEQIIREEMDRIGGEEMAMPVVQPAELWQETGRFEKMGEFLGGAIAPGLNISAEALFARAARLPRVEIKKPVKIIGTNTVDNLQIGLFYGHIGLVDSILERMIAELGPGTKTVATGGLAKLIAGGSKHINAVDEMLTLTGLRLIYERNLDRHRKRGA